MKRISLYVVCLLILSSVCCVYESSMPANDEMNLTNYVVIDYNISRIVENNKDTNDSWNKILVGGIDESTYAHDKLFGNNVCRAFDTP